MRLNSFKFLIIPAIGTIVGCSSMFFLPSCSFTKPDLIIPNNGVENLYNHDFEVCANWIGYYSNDVYAETDIPPSYLPYIEFKQTKTQVYPTESLKLDFTFHDIEQCPANLRLQSFDIKIDWYVNHTSVHKQTIEKILPQASANTISWNRTYSCSSIPTLIDTTNQPKFANGNSFTCIDGYYNNKNYANGQQWSMDNIQKNINNDIIYYQYLIFQNLKNVKVGQNIPVIGDIYISLDESTWKMNLSLSYDVDTQTFNYIQFNITANGNWGMFKNIATMNINYAWGNDSQAIAQGFGVLKQFDSSNNVSYHNFVIPDCVGPKLLGAYSIFRDHNNINLLHQQPDNSAPFFTQNFLSFVPSDEDPHKCYQFYDFCIFVNNSMFQTIVGKYIGSGYHIYFGRQPRMFSLELITGSDIIKVYYPPTHQYHPDGFANLGLAIPSFSLTDVSYSQNNEFILPSTLPEIEQCKVDIDTKYPNIKNLTYPGDFDGFKNHFFDDNSDDDNGEYWYHFHEIDDPNNPDYPGIGDFIYELDGDKTNVHPIDPYGDISKSRFDRRLNNLTLKNTQIQNGAWDDLTIIDNATQTPLASNIPWWQIIQVRSQRSGEQPPNDQNCKNFACFTNIDPDNSHCALPSFVWDNATNKFTRFAIGLNYMFKPSVDTNAVAQITIDPNQSLPISGDNMFWYVGDSLNNIVYDNNG